MTPLYLQLLMPAVQVLGAWVISARISWKNHPALIAWLASQVFFSAAGSGLPHFVLLVRCAVIAAVVFEVLTFSRVGVPRESRGLWVGLALATSALLSARVPMLTGVQKAYLFRSNFLWIAAVVLATVTLWRAIHPMLECRRHTIYRIGATTWLLGLAISGSFVPGGLGYQRFPYTRHTWEMVNTFSYWSLIATVGCMSLAMRMSVKPRKRNAHGALVRQVGARVLAMGRAA